MGALNRKNHVGGEGPLRLLPNYDERRLTSCAVKIGRVRLPALRLKRRYRVSIDRPLHRRYDTPTCGPVAQLGERHNGIVEVRGSSPLRSTDELA